MTTNEEKRYGPTTGLVTGWIGVVGCAAAAICLPFTGQDRTTFRFALVFALAGVVIWAFLARPRIVLTSTTLVLRNPLSSWSLPVGLIDEVIVGFATRVTAVGRTYDATAVSRPPRAFARPATKRWASPDLVVEIMVQDVLAAAKLARAAGPEAGTIQRHWAVPELSAIGVLSLALLVLFV